jgi:hypothetical protein
MRRVCLAFLPPSGAVSDVVVVEYFGDTRSAV